MKKCEDCRYWKNNVDWGVDLGTCHRSFPQCTDEGTNAYWPATHSSDWCGEFKEKEEENVP